MSTESGLPQVLPTTGPLLVADVGGTNARFGWIERPGGKAEHVRSLSTLGHAGPVEAVQSYLAQVAHAIGPRYAVPRRAAFAVATALDGDRIALTNSSWDFSRRDVHARLGFDETIWLNDFEALALALPRLGPSQWRSVGGPDGPSAAAAADAHQVLAVVGPGTGLGVAGIVRTAGGWLPLPGEGGHATLAAGDALEDAVIELVRRDHGHVSAERLLSGMGLPTLHRAVVMASGGNWSQIAERTPELIVAAGLAGHEARQAGREAPHAQQMADRTLGLFCALLGSFCGNVALTLGARQGLYLGGGILPRLGARLDESSFRARFEAKGRFARYLQPVPTRLILDTQVALIGAASTLAGA